MLAGLVDAENEQLLNGSGVAPDLVGLVATSASRPSARPAPTSTPSPRP